MLLLSLLFVSSSKLTRCLRTFSGNFLTAHLATDARLYYADLLFIVYGKPPVSATSATFSHRRETVEYDFHSVDPNATPSPT
ncbi:hypothetical protein TYRP_017331 [Tyrophagus putrescentiae]|nr:hypothetical protein TYRP_017331 [Tyrophagus putrescentiae]